MLVGRHGSLVTKQQLLDAVWAGAFVEEANLSFNVSTLRKALGDGQDGSRYIETVPTRGYRFVAPVNERAGEPPSPRVHAGAASRRRVPVAIAIVAGVPLLLLAAMPFVAQRSETVASPPTCPHLATTRYRCHPRRSECVLGALDGRTLPIGKHAPRVAHRRQRYLEVHVEYAKR